MSDSSSTDSAATEPSAPTPPSSDAPWPVNGLESLNRWLGTFEHAVIAFFLAVMVIVGAVKAIAGTIFSANIEGSDEILRSTVYFLAMGGAALAAQKLRMIAMDVVTRSLPPRVRAMTRVVGTCVVLIACYLIIEASLKVRTDELQFHQSYVYVPRSLVLLSLPVGTALIGVHYIIHTAIDLAYLCRGMTPPAREEVGGH